MSLIDALLLRAALAVHAARRFLATVTFAQFLLPVSLACNAVMAVSLAVETTTGPAVILAVSLVIITALSVGVVVDARRERMRAAVANRRLMELLKAAPSGAPRIAEVPCWHGLPHRFLYVPSKGWLLDEFWTKSALSSPEGR